MTVTIGKLLDKKKFEVKFVIVYPFDEEYPICKYIPEDYEVLRIKNKSFIDYPHSVPLIYKLLKKEKPDFCFSSLAFVNIMVLAAAKLAGVKAILRMDNYLSIESWRRMLLIRALYPTAYRIVAQQEEMADDFLKHIRYNKKHLLTLHNPIDEEGIKARLGCDNPYPQTGETNYLWVANFSYTKGHDILVKAFVELNRRNPNAHLYIVGRFMDTIHNCYQVCKDIVRDNKLDKYVHFIGFDSNPYRWVQYCDCFVLPSRIEGLPNALVDAMYLGRPVAATKCIPIISRMVKDGYNGYLAESENPQSLADAMEKAVNLKNFEMIYHPSTNKEFEAIFE